MSDDTEVPAGRGDAGRRSADGDGKKGGERSFLTPERLERYRERLFDAAILGLPIAIINWTVGKISGPLTSQPWHILWFIAPLALAAWIAWHHVTKRGAFRVRGAMLLFLVLYLSVFTLAAGSDVLVWKRSMVTVEQEQAPRSWLVPARWGDWHYRFAPRTAPEDRLVVVTMEAPVEGATRSALRFELARLIQVAARNGAVGIAFDFYFRADEPSDMDAFLCGVVKAARIPVIAGHRLAKGETGHLFAEPFPDSIDEGCFPEDHKGHLLLYRDADGLVRNAALRVRNWDSLGMRVAGQLSRDREPPDKPMMQYLAPRDCISPLKYERFAVLPPEEMSGVLKGRFLLVGERSPAETFHTPFGDLPGVEVHAAAIGSLLAGGWITRPPWWSGFLMIVVACYLITALAADGMSLRKLLAVALGVSVSLAAAAALAMRLWNVWLDLVYPLMAIWVLVALLLLLRRRLGTRATS